MHDILATVILEDNQKLNQHNFDYIMFRLKRTGLMKSDNRSKVSSFIEHWVKNIDDSKYYIEYIKGL